MIAAKTLSDLPESGEIYIFGASRGGQMLLELLRKLPRIKVIGFIDNQKTGTVLGFPVIDFDTFISTRKENVEIVIASMYVYEIAAQLRRSGIKKFYNAHPLVVEKIKEKEKMKRTAFMVFGIFLSILLLSALTLYVF
ncbi:hypothetical protein ACCD06_27860 [Azospirillum sp. CT11-132]|uniref:PglD-related sugar-binding protein n=1 Tax=Azospirillum sp. CT11-132 TaxID=3396317 RepID=UPI0039A42320